MVCGGSMEVLVEPLTPDRDLSWVSALLGKSEEGKQVFLVRRLDENRGECQVLHVAAEGEVPSKLSALPTSFEDERARIVVAPPTDSREGVSILIEKVLPREVLLLFGAGHVGVALCEVASLLEFDVHVLDDRRPFVTPERFPRARRLSASTWEKMLDKIPEGEHVYCVLLTHSYTEDVMVLEKLAGRRFAYVGAIGSRRRTATVRRLLQERGTNPEDLGRFYSPIGIDIGAQTPAEIAVSIAAELVAVRNRRIPPPSSLSGE
jgi:xanthine/CO dehydrogenase XdhC/CoxF family maturation factor